MIKVFNESWVITLGISFPSTWQQIHIFSDGKKSFLGRYVKMIISLHRGGTAKWLQYYMGGYAQMITILQRGGGVSRDPQKWLRNMCTTPYLVLCIWKRWVSLFMVNIYLGREGRWGLWWFLCAGCCFGVEGWSWLAAFQLPRVIKIIHRVCMTWSG